MVHTGGWAEKAHRQLLQDRWHTHHQHQADDNQTGDDNGPPTPATNKSFVARREQGEERGEV